MAVSYITNNPFPFFTLKIYLQSCYIIFVALSADPRSFQKRRFLISMRFFKAYIKITLPKTDFSFYLVPEMSGYHS